MKFLFSALCLLSCINLTNAQCVGTIRSGGASACQQASVSPVNIVVNSNKISIPKFDDTSVPTAIVDGVHIVALTVSYEPIGSFSTSSSASNFFVQASVTFTSATSSADNTLVVDPEWSTLPGTFGRAGNTAGSGADGLIQRTLLRRDVSYESSTLVAADGTRTFTPASGAVVTNSFISFTSSSGEISMDVPTDADYRGASGTWDLTFAYDPLASSSFAGAGLTVSLSQVLTVSALVQYDYHLPSISGDPQFVGFHGQSYQVHGVPDEAFALISTPHYYVNAKFMYVSTGSCFYNDTACFSHPGTYMSEIYIGMAGTSVFVVAGPHSEGLRAVYVNGHNLASGPRIVFSQIGNFSFVQRISASTVVLQLDSLSLTIVNSDNFVNIQINFGDYALLKAGSQYHMIHATEHSAVAASLAKHYPNIPLHGLIGQTWRNVEFPGNDFIEGDVPDYQLDSIKSFRFLFSKYHRTK